MRPLVFVLALLVPLTAGAQIISFERTYGGTESDAGYSVVQVADGGYVVAGYTKSFGADSSDMLCFKVDAVGDPVWTRLYAASLQERAFSLAQTDDGGFILVGHTASYTAPPPIWADVYVVKTNQWGDTLWTCTYGGVEVDEAQSVAQTADGGYIIAGSTFSFGAGGYDVWLIKTNSNGDTAWTRTYGGPDRDNGYSVAQTADGGYLIAGMTDSFGAGGNDVYLLRADSLGDTLWTRTYGGIGSDVGRSVAQTGDGGYIIAGSTLSFGAGGTDVYLVKTDSNGDTAWTRTFGAGLHDSGYSVAQTDDGGYIVAGNSESFGVGSNDVWLLKTDSSGDTVWTRTYGGTGYDAGESVAQTADGGYIIAGSTQSFGAGSNDVYLIKTDANGQVGVNHAPDLVDQADTTVAENQYLTFTLEAIDPDGDSIFFFSPDLPEGAALNSLTGHFWWTPTYAQSGLYTVTFIATDLGYPALSDTEQTDITVTDVVGVADDEDELGSLAQYLAQNRPNPFGSSTTISYSLKRRGPASVAVYDIRGALVRELVDETVAAGVHRVIWDGRDGQGREVGSGIYFCRLEAGAFTETRRMVLLH
ncbi:MAG: hypothetical protein AMJ46_14620 [Latescibacteria bacterium DG_63]|uniref:FlgD/Vpr Ig-like domain-containing protein n=1 Tax=candidate division TA06 bacterium SM23_40 TaxID=1703774 RepID=A0A0S8G093_UNCT6|nr:MAG: hypothetical protein AMJ46_14620 [Latescibacteria bacterium DG_63]KPK65642.1 MAG: hypothetical protein AMJ82_12355 [candidate division TA06 bacterium SM23_40]